ncbi:ERCC4 domain-containing protein [Clostridium sp.]|uniref:ERCC4 domain-containing protein n=1 Tax=Clostridium sp. TaxID=1506 RepID=UPI002906667F|nr:ERCC4 domain-containing protein [Clostridium sp.]MDU3409982.1 hypothetical protein [Clostridium sp.]
MRKLTEKEIKKQIDRIVIYVDSREKNIPNHITKCFDKYGIQWQIKQLKSGDYSAILPEDIELGISEINLVDILCVERKMSCDEIIQNLTKYKERFYKEFERSNATIPILIEDSFKNACEGDYRSKVTPNQFLGALFTFCDKNKTFFYFMEDRSLSALWIYDIFKYRIRNILKGIEIEKY